MGKSMPESMSMGIIITMADMNGRPVVPRTGYVVEINALWYNALKFIEEMAVLTRNEEVQNSLGP